ncbi:MAG: ZIP family metal transporter [Candidatus Hadarchaeum sp.]|uniref:ZIP family metal transporter n=1 Tax=Candidatus Hadarchaeum sp. TaxID=2883567 RepID=UPI003178D0B5
MEGMVSILLATFLVSLISFVGAMTLVVSERLLKYILLALVGLSAGALIGGAFLHLLPEAIEETAGVEIGNVFQAVIVGFVIFFILEKLLWRHCHEKSCPIHTFAYLNLVGDGVHNFIDGLIIASGFLASPQLGLVTALAVAAHEVPQELGDFGVIVYGGMKPRVALLLNFVTALTAVAGGLFGYYFFSHLEHAMTFLLPFAAGGFLYIAAADLIPELHKESDRAKTVLSFLMFMVGIALMLVIKILLGG